MLLDLYHHYKDRVFGEEGPRLLLEYALSLVRVFTHPEGPEIVPHHSLKEYWEPVLILQTRNS